MSTFDVYTFYYFKPLEEQKLELYKETLNQLASKYKVAGLVIMGVEGINTTLSGNGEKLDEFVENVRRLFDLPELHVKKSQCHKRSFKRFNVKIRDEIVTLKRPDLVPKELSHFHLPPEKWQEYMEREDTVIIDTRNTYEIEIGKFKNAVDLGMDEFQEYPDKIKGLDKDKTYLIYCTGGIRCEKAILEMQAQGFKDVYQLEGGILNYLEQYPNRDWEGECFVFDSRVAVDQNLNPSTQYSLCPHCGDVATKKYECPKCGAPSMICSKCEAKAIETGANHLYTCSKNCSYHYRRDPHTKSPQQQQFYHA